ncbi:MAG: RNA methyltransferase [Bacteroidales bacterium]|nr:RNA methyltransferase [Bacteroidales bacterium]
MKKTLNSELGRLNVEDFKKSKKIPLTIVLDNIRSLNNIGSVFRTGDAFRIQEILLCGITATPPNRDIHKTALGAEDSVCWRYFETTQQAIQSLKSENFFVAAIEQAHESTSLPDFQPPHQQPLAIIFGNEVEGVAEEIMNIVDDCIEIPQFGTKHSLNISVSAGIVMWELFQKMNNIIS